MIDSYEKGNKGDTMEEWMEKEQRILDLWR